MRNLAGKTVSKIFFSASLSGHVMLCSVAHFFLMADKAICFRGRAGDSENSVKTLKTEEYRNCVHNCLTNPSSCYMMQQGQIDDLRLGAQESYAWEALASVEDLQDKLTPIISKINRTLEAALRVNEVSRRLAIRRRPYGVDVPRFRILKDPCPHG